MPVKIMLIGNYPPDNQKSMEVYCNILYESLTAEGLSTVIVRPTAVFCRGRGSGNGFGKFLAYIDKFVVFSLRLLLIQFRYTRVHVCDHSNALYRFVLFGPHVSITCHDVIAIMAGISKSSIYRTRLTGRLFQRLILMALIRFPKIFCASEATRTQLLTLKPSALARLPPARHVCSSDFYLDSNSKDAIVGFLPPQVIAGQFFLHVGSDLPRKNRSYAFEIFERLIADNQYRDASLVFVGPPANKEMAARILASDLRDRCFFLPNVRVEVLRALYNSAAGLIFPSRHEGFGFPIVEAQACGCPVFASNVEPHPEVGGAAACYFPLDSPEDAALLILQANVSSIRKDGIVNSRRFSPDGLIRHIFADCLRGT